MLYIFSVGCALQQWCQALTKLSLLLAGLKTEKASKLAQLKTFKPRSLPSLEQVYIILKPSLCGSQSFFGICMQRFTVNCLLDMFSTSLKSNYICHGVTFNCKHFSRVAVKTTHPFLELSNCCWTTIKIYG